VPSCKKRGNKTSDCIFKVAGRLQVEKRAGAVTAYGHITRGPLFDFMSGVIKTHTDTQPSTSWSGGFRYLRLPVVSISDGRQPFIIADGPENSAVKNTVEPGYNDIGLYDTSPIASDIVWYQLIPHCWP
jgi:hypothetical protein